MQGLVRGLHTCTPDFRAFCASRGIIGTPGLLSRDTTKLAILLGILCELGEGRPSKRFIKEHS